MCTSTMSGLVVTLIIPLLVGQVVLDRPRLENDNIVDVEDDVPHDYSKQEFLALKRGGQHGE